MTARIGSERNHVIQVHSVRELLVAGTAGTTTIDHLSAASGMVRIGNRLYVVADDENSLGVFNLSSDEPGQLVRLFDGDLPDDHKARKAAKPDFEALLALPAFAGYPSGALMSIGSGSRRSRHRAALMALGADGDIRGPARRIDLAPLLIPLQAHVPDLNIEGAFVSTDTVCLLQRGNSRPAINACIALPWGDMERWLDGAGQAPTATSITQFELGSIGGVPLSFTDGAALPGGSWVFCAAAEDTSNSYADGQCAGSAVGVVNAAGKIQYLESLSLACKVEGITASADGDTLNVLLVTDADDRQTPALLLSATLHIGTPSSA